MLTSYITGLVAIVLVTLAWVGVQNAWRRTFSDASPDPDVLAGRMSCHGCTGHDGTGHGCSPGSCTPRKGRAENDQNHGRIVAAEEDMS